MNDKRSSFLGIQTQPGISVRNLLVIPYIQTLATAGVIYCSTRILFMLRDKDYFAVGSNQIGRVNSSLIFNAMLFTIPISLVSGYCYDLFGRKLLVLINSFIMCLLCWITPYTSPNLLMLQITYVLVRATLIFVSCNPLMADYVDKHSLGKASALQNMGILVGDCFAMGFLMSITSQMSHENAFMMTAVITALLVVPLFFMIAEPQIDDSG
jgi:MFS family permease